MVLHPDDAAFLEIKARIRAIFFDLDGTLIDTDDAFLDGLAGRMGRWMRLFTKRDPRRLLRRFVLFAERPVNAAVTLLDAVGLDDNVLDLGDRLRRLPGLRVRGKFVPVDGVLDTLQQLRRSYVLGVITTRSRADAQAFIVQFGLGDLLQVVTTREDTERLKPHPEPLRYSVSCLGLSPAQCVMVGDTPVDVISAKAAGAYAVGVLCGFGERRELEEAGADLVLENTSHLAEWF